MSLFKRGKTWWVRFSTPDGQQVRQSAKTANKQLAQEFHDQLKASYWRVSQLGERPRRTWEQAVERWLTEKQGEKASLQDDIGHLRWLHGHLFGRYLDEINRPECRRARDTFWDIQVTKMTALGDSLWAPARPASAALRRHHRKLDAGSAPLPQWLDGVSDAHAYALRRLRDLRPLRQLRPYACAYACRGLRAFASLSWRAARVDRTCTRFQDLYLAR